MGSSLEINDTLQLTTSQGFPAEILDLERHLKNPVTLKDVGDRVFTFRNKSSARIFQLDPVRVYYAHNIDGRWLFWGHVLIQSLMIEKSLGSEGLWKEGEWVTSGTYRIAEIYEPEYQKIFTKRESPQGRSFFSF